LAIRYITALFILCAFLVTPFSEASAWRNKKPVTPYGDFCKRCSQYGMCKSAMSIEDSKGAIIDYYHKKGLTVEIENVKGRFIKANIKDKNRIVDVIIFDRRSGRIRSIY
jgi:hypothetical protein